MRWRGWIHCSECRSNPVDQGGCVHQEGLAVNKEWQIFEKRKIKTKNKSESAPAKEASWRMRRSNLDFKSPSVRYLGHRPNWILHTAEAKPSFSLFSVLSHYVSLPSKSISSALTLIKEHITEQSRREWLAEISGSPVFARWGNESATVSFIAAPLQTNTYNREEKAVRLTRCVWEMHYSCPVYEMFSCV